MANGIEGPRGSRRGAARVIGACLLALAASGPGAAANEDVALSGRVVERDPGGRPIAGAEVSLSPDVAPGTIPDPDPLQVVAADADGRFTLKLGDGLPSKVVVRVRHPLYIARKSVPKSVARMREEAARGVPPFFHTVALEPGEEYRATVVTPEDEPAAGVVVSMGGEHSGPVSPHFEDDGTALTDADGRVRIRLAKAKNLGVRITSDEFLTLTGNGGMPRSPGGRLPGKYVLSRGGAIAGRVVDLGGKPLAGVGVGAYYSSRDHSNREGQFDPSRYMTLGYTSREARTDAAGAFRLVGLKPGSYVVGQTGVKVGDGPRPEVAHPIGPRRVDVEAGGSADVLLREVESVQVEARFVDSRGRPVTGHAASFSGEFPVEPAEAGRPRPDPHNLPRAKADPPAGEDYPVRWRVRVEADPGGRVVARVPKRMVNTRVAARTNVGARDGSGGTTYFTIRAMPGVDPVAADIQNSGYARLGELKGDIAEITFIVHARRPPELSVRVVAEDTGRMPQNLYFRISTRHMGMGHGVACELGSDGVYRTEGMHADRPYEFYAQAAGYITSRVRGITLPEGGSRELTVTLRRADQAAKVGDLAPPIFVTTLDGRRRSLADYKGRFLLVSVIGSEGNNNEDFLFKLKVIRDRFGDGGRLALLGLGYDSDQNPEALAALVAKNKLDWPHARLDTSPEDTSYDALQATYGLKGYPTAFLIGPDGTIVEKGLRADNMDWYVARALGAK